MTRLQEYQNIFQSSFPTINIEDIAIVHEKFQLHMLCGKWELLKTLQKNQIEIPEEQQ